MTPRRIQRKRTKGWRMPEGAVYVGRPTRWGNPFEVGSAVGISGMGNDGLYFDLSTSLTACQAVELYRKETSWRISDEGLTHPDDLARMEQWRRDLAELRGRDLVCWCPPDQPCHADVLLEVANA